MAIIINISIDNSCKRNVSDLLSIFFLQSYIKKIEMQYFIVIFGIDDKNIHKKSLAAYENCHEIMNNTYLLEIAENDTTSVSVRNKIYTSSGIRSLDVMAIRFDLNLRSAWALSKKSADLLATIYKTIENGSEE
jgi:hypothetical protein